MNDMVVTEKSEEESFLQSPIKVNVFVSHDRIAICGDRQELMNGHIHFQKDNINAFKYVFM
jgi:hypothetical protein